MQDLERDLPVVLEIVREIDRGHAAAPELALDEVAVRQTRPGGGLGDLAQVDGPTRSYAPRVGHRDFVWARRLLSLIGRGNRGQEQTTWIDVAGGLMLSGRLSHVVSSSLLFRQRSPAGSSTPPSRKKAPIVE